MERRGISCIVNKWVEDKSLCYLIFVSISSYSLRKTGSDCETVRWRSTLGAEPIDYHISQLLNNGHFSALMANEVRAFKGKSLCFGYIHMTRDPSLNSRACEHRCSQIYLETISNRPADKQRREEVRAGEKKNWGVEGDRAGERQQRKAWRNSLKEGR